MPRPHAPDCRDHKTRFRDSSPGQSHGGPINLHPMPATAIQCQQLLTTPEASIVYSPPPSFQNIGRLISKPQGSTPLPTACCLSQTASSSCEEREGRPCRGSKGSRVLLALLTPFLHPFCLPLCLCPVSGPVSYHQIWDAVITP